MENDQFIKFRKELGKHIQAVRKERGLSQEELASKIGLDRVAVGYIEQGIRSPKLRTLFQISNALNLNIKDLFDL